MTELLKKAFDQASRLSTQEQDAFAAWLLNELEADERWQRAFAASAGRLVDLAGEAMMEHREGRTHVLDPERLWFWIGSHADYDRLLSE